MWYYQIFSVWLLFGIQANSWGRFAGGRQVDREGVGREAYKQETDGCEGNCKKDCAA